ncbi:cytochrome P450 [Mycena amicta]|nr:cytochrome P450 [Mycena amicta]
MSLLPISYLGFAVTAVFSIWILNMIEIPKEFGEFDGVWCKAYGPVYRFKGGFGVRVFNLAYVSDVHFVSSQRDRLMVSDTAALRFLYNSNDIELAPASDAFVNWLFGEAGISARRGQDHRQLRAALNVGFTPEAMRNYRPLFEGVAQRISEKLGATINSSEESTVVDMVPLLNAATFSATSEVEELSADLVRANGEVMALSAAVAPGQVLVNEILNLNIFPRWLLRQVVKLPGKAFKFSFKILRDHIRFTETEGRRLVQQKLDLARKGAVNVDEASDVYTRVLHDSILGTATKAQIGLDDLVRQTSTMMLAGQNATASTVAFLLMELSRRPASQDSLRKEIDELSARGLPYDQYPQLNAMLKETQRMYPHRPHLLPLESRWGADADTFDPSRWIEGRVPQGDAIGPYANLLAFASGPHHCLGWRFAILEIQVIICELIRNFAFSMPVDEVIVPVYASVLMPADANGRKCAALVVKKLV